MLQAFDTLRDLFNEAIANYFDDVNLRDLIDFIQADVSSCCYIELMCGIGLMFPLLCLAISMLWSIWA